MSKKRKEDLVEGGILGRMDILHNFEDFINTEKLISNIRKNITDMFQEELNFFKNILSPKSEFGDIENIDLSNIEDFKSKIKEIAKKNPEAKIKAYAYVFTKEKNEKPKLKTFTYNSEKPIKKSNKKKKK